MTQFTCKGVKQINNRISLNMTFTVTIRISRRFSSAQEFQMENFQKYWSQNVGQDFIVPYLIFFTDGRFWKLTGGKEGTLKMGRKILPPEGSHVCRRSWITTFFSCFAFLIFSFELVCSHFQHNFLLVRNCRHIVLIHTDITVLCLFKSFQLFKSYGILMI